MKTPIPFRPHGERLTLEDLVYAILPKAKRPGVTTSQIADALNISLQTLEALCERLDKLSEPATGGFLEGNIPLREETVKLLCLQLDREAAGQASE
jgi:orotate phosphoribosyltransferase-like protein